VEILKMEKEYSTEELSTSYKSSPNFYQFTEDEKTSKISKYQDLIIGNRSYWNLIKYELLTLLLTNIPGLLGLFFRQKLYNFIMQKMAHGVVIGMGVSLKQPNKISIGRSTVIDDMVSLSVRGSELAHINICKNVYIGKGTILNARDGSIEIDDFSNIGSNCRIATPGGKLHIGQYVMIAAFCYIGGGNHKVDRTDIPMAKQGYETRGGVIIEDDVWIGANTVISDGIKIGRGSIIGACSYVNREIPAYSIAFGSPAKVQRNRK
jgi:acetyltransferase-like isoleucine patch superfamily enzyme